MDVEDKTLWEYRLPYKNIIESSTDVTETIVCISRRDWSSLPSIGKVNIERLLSWNTSDSLPL